MRNRQPLKQIPIEYSPWEYLELITPPEYEAYSARALANVAIPLTHKLHKQGKFAIFLPHRASGTSAIPNHSTDSAHALFEKNPPKRTTLSLTEDNYRILRILAAENNINQQTAVIFCLKVLRYYTDRKGPEILNDWEINRPSGTGILSPVPVATIHEINRDRAIRGMSLGEYLQYLLNLRPTESGPVDLE